MSNKREILSMVLVGIAIVSIIFSSIYSILLIKELEDKTVVTYKAITFADSMCAISDNYLKGLAGEKLEVFDIVYVKNNKLYLLDNDTTQFIFMVINNKVSANDSVDLIHTGLVKNHKWNFTKGEVYTMNGKELTLTPCRGAKSVGIAIKKNYMVFNLDGLE